MDCPRRATRFVAAAAAVLFLATGVSAIWRTTLSAEPQASHELAKSASAAAEEVYKSYVADAVGDTVRERCEWSRRWAEAQAKEGSTDSKAAYAAHAARMKELEDFVAELAKANRATSRDRAVVRFYLLEAQLLMK